ncbi:hypothetical protein ABTD73_21875, partial [Acinetobacter baumannii]
AQIFAAEARCDLPDIGRLRGQPPVKPFAMGPARPAAGTDTVATRGPANMTFSSWAAAAPAARPHCTSRCAAVVSCS